MFLFLCWLCFLQDSCCQATEFLPGEIELVAHLLTLLSIQLFELGGSSDHASVGPIGDGRDHLQIAQQFLEGRARCPGSVSRCVFKNNCGCSRRRCRIWGEASRQATYNCPACRLVNLCRANTAAIC